MDLRWHRAAPLLSTTRTHISPKYSRSVQAPRHIMWSCGYLRGLHLHFHYNPTQRQLLIVSDSLSALHSIAEPPNNHSMKPRVLYIRTLLQHLLGAQNTLTSFMWIPSNWGIEGNECVNKAAKAGCLSKSISQNLIWRIVRDENEAQWTRLYSRKIRHLSHYYLLENTITLLKFINRNFVVTICRLRPNLSRLSGN